MLPTLHLQSAQPVALHPNTPGETAMAQAVLPQAGMAQVGLHQVGSAQAGLAQAGLAQAGLAQAGVHQAVTGLAAADPAAGDQVVVLRDAAPDSTAEPVVWDGLLPGLLVGEQIGVGRRCLVFAASCDGADVVIKRYRSEAIVKHAELADMPLAEFEFRRNQACYAVPGLHRNVARPFGYYVGSGAQWLVQQRVHGQLCSDSSVGWSEPQWRALRERLLELVALAHQAGLYDLDLHPGNVMLSRTSGDAEPILFDFNLVPFIERRRLTLDGWLYRLGLVNASYRDLRRVRKRFR